MVPLASGVDVESAVFKTRFLSPATVLVADDETDRSVSIVGDSNYNSD